MERKLKYHTGAYVLEEREKDGVLFLTYPLLEQTKMVRHGFSTRVGGVSEGMFGTMNLSFTRGDDEAAVQENFRRIGNAIGVKPEQMVLSKQTHTTNVREVTKKDCGNGIVRENIFEDVDGLVTNEPGVCLATLYADCVPLYFVDPVKRAIGLSHSGWRGTVGKIGKITVEKMRECYGSDPKDIRAAVGPSICQSCYEVSEDVIRQFRENFREELWSDLFYRKSNGKYQLNLWKANEAVFTEAGIRPEHMAITNVCTCCNSELLFSHRASQGRRGNLGAFLAIKEDMDERDIINE
mgnify:FL=1